MWQASAAFATEVRRSHTTAAKVDIHVPGGGVIASTDRNLLLVDGEVFDDRRAVIRRRFQATFIDYDGTLTPMKGSPLNTDPFDAINHYEFRPYRGVQYSDGTTEYVPLGVYYIKQEDIQPNDRGGYTELSVTLYDRSWAWSSHKLVVPYANEFTTTPIGVLYDVFYSTMPPWMAMQKDGGPYPNVNWDKYYLGVGDDFQGGAFKINTGDDPWEAMINLGDGVARELFFGRLGEFNAWKIFDPDTEVPVSASFDEGAGGVFVSPPRRSIDIDDVYTGVQVKGSAPWLIYPVSATVWDVDPRSFTNSQGPLGEKPFIIEDAHVTNEAMAAEAARAAFSKNVGVLENITFDVPVDPRFDSGDVIYISSASSGVEGRYSLETIQIPLIDRPMTATTRRRRRT